MKLLDKGVKTVVVMDNSLWKGLQLVRRGLGGLRRVYSCPKGYMECRAHP